MNSSINLWRHIQLGVLFILGMMICPCSAYVGRSRLEAAWRLPSYRISLHGLPTINQVSTQDTINVPSKAMVEMLIQPLAPVRAQVRITSYFISEGDQMQYWSVELDSYNEDTFILRSQASRLPGVTSAQHKLIFIVYRSNLQGYIINKMIEMLPYGAALKCASWLQGHILYASVGVV